MTDGFHGDEPEIASRRWDEYQSRNDPDIARDASIQEEYEQEKKNRFVKLLHYDDVIWTIIAKIESANVDHLVSVRIGNSPNLLRFINFETWAELKRLIGIEHELDKARKVLTPMTEITPPNANEIVHFEIRGDGNT